MSGSAPTLDTLARDEVYCRNMAALFRADLRLAQRIDECVDDGSVIVEPAKHGALTVAVRVPGSDRPFYLHSRVDPETEAKRLVQVQLALPGYEMVLKAAHTFNLLDARGAISVTERAAYIGRIRNLARGVSQSYFDSRLRQDFPMCTAEQLHRLGIDLAALKTDLDKRKGAA